MATYIVIDRHTHCTVKVCKNLKAALRHADKLDLAYGAIRYGVRAIVSDTTPPDRCPECERSNGPHYTGPCAHGVRS